MQTRFLLGPAGSGKTFRCAEEIRAQLRAEPQGSPLVFVAPKQATFQIERQLLADGGLAGYTRLHILSFERLAGFVFTRFRQTLPSFLDEEGRVMVLRALLARKRNDLKLFRASARLPGFARQLSQLLRELQRYQLTPAKLEALGKKVGPTSQLDHKLNDLALLLRAYRAWLEEHELKDADTLLDEATILLRQVAPETSSEADPRLRLGGLWLDGFAEMTPQELDLIAALAPHCDQATLAFCLESEPHGDLSWLSTWSVVARTFRQCHQRLAGPDGTGASVEILSRRPEHSRFRDNALFRHLEQHWTKPVEFTRHALRVTRSSQEEEAAASSDTTTAPHSPLRVVQCANVEAEATLVVREVLRFVRSTPGNRYRDCAVLVRTLDGYHDVLRRVFARYQIPFFLDRRESVAHHPLAELTRSALRVATFNWMHDDWFGALKTGLTGVREEDIDLLENEALARGWEGKKWGEPLVLPDNERLGARLERLRTQLVPPFQALAAHLAGAISGPQLAGALRDFWHTMGLEEQLESWSRTPADPESTPEIERQAHVHQTVWQQMQEWLGNVERAFSHDALPPREWLPILDAGLANLTVGVIPPVLDQVLIGTIDRSRNPDLKFVALLGMNEAVFPATPAPATLLTDADREALARYGAELGLTARQQIGHERYYGYIACTRARQQLLLTYAARNADDQVLNPSPFISHLQRLFPDLSTENASPHPPWTESEHVCELAAPLLKCHVPPQFSSLAELRHGMAHLHELESDTALSPTLAEKLYGPNLRTSVSRLEQFASCPFKFLVHSGLRADERKRFEVDARERGSFQHEILARFHAEVRAQDQQWRDLTPTEARDLVGRIASELAEEFRDGLFQATDHSLFTARSLTGALQNFMATLIGWMANYGFDPHAVELAFGTAEQTLPAWELDLGSGRRMTFGGKIDRIDLWTDRERDEAWCVVLDYKSSSRKIDPLLLEHGIQIQLPAYLAALCQLDDSRSHFGVGRLVPAGMFYVNLRGDYGRGPSRRDVLGTTEEAIRQAYQHFGRFSLAALPKLDRGFAQPETQSGQF